MSQPDFGSGLPDYPAGVGVCLSRAEYDSAGNLNKVILPTAGWNTSTSKPVDTNRYVAYSYTDDRLVAAVDAPSPKTGNTRVTASRTIYDAVGQQVKTVDALGHQQTMAYTADRLVGRTEAQSWRPAGTTADLTHVTTFGYDANGNKTSETDGLNQTATWGYWSDNLLKETTDPGTNKTSYRYDLAGNPTTVTAPSANARDATNPSGTPTVNSYTADNLLLSATTPVAGDGSSRRQVGYSYDAGSRKIAQQTVTVNASGAVTAAAGTQRFAYHPDDRLRQEIGRDGATITTRYDAAGNRIEVTDSSGSSLTGTYYLDGLPRSVSDGARQAFYSYDGAGQLTYRADATSTAGNASRYTTTYVANDGGQLASANSSLTGSGNWTWTWDDAGRPERETAPNGQTTTRTWNPDDTLARQATTSSTQTLADWTYTYDALFRQKTQGWAGTSAVGGSAVSGTFSYGYDAAGRVNSFNDGATTKTLSWDHDGNRLSYGTQTFTYNADDSVATTDPDGPGTAGLKTSMYTTVGAVSADGTWCYSYDGFDRLASVAIPGSGGSCTSGTGTPTTYLYDGLDRQRSRTANSATTAFHYAGWAGATTVEMPSGGNDTAYVIDRAGQRKALATQGLLGATEYLTDDGYGNLTTATSTTAVVGCTARFDPFGNPLQGPASDANHGTDANPCSTGSTKNTAFYRGGRIDTTTGDYQFGSRTYDPKKSTFLTPDSYRGGEPAQNLAVGVDPLTRNTYAYVNGDPINYLDPDGHAPQRMYVCADLGDGVEYCPVSVTSKGTSSLRRLGTHRPSSSGITRGKTAPKSVAALSCPSGTAPTNMVPATRYPSTWNSRTCMEPGEMPSVSTMVHGTLGILGFIPALGAVPDALDAVIYSTQGNLDDAKWSIIAAVPAAGDWAKGARHLDEAGEAIRTARRIKAVNLPAWRRVGIDIEHIGSGHIAGGSRVSPLKDLFPEQWSRMQVERNVRQAYRYSERISSQGPRVLVRGRASGVTIEMWVNTETRSIETAYPVWGR